jgi:preprotein translocase subunit SecA
MKNNINEDLLSIVKSINAHYSSVQSLSNDELRDKVANIEALIANSNDKQEVLDNFLPEVYAIVKETAHRLTMGDVIVSAKSNDEYLAENYDFVKIEGEKAIYRNKWSAGGQLMTWSMVHYDEQLMGGILLHHGYAVEMATGEGKTLVATLPVFLNALSHKGVHVMTVNDYLSKRDFEITRPIYMLYGLTADCIEYYSRFDRRRKSAYDADITFGTNSSFTFDYLKDHLEITPKACVQKDHYYAIIDELDSILIDDADDPHIVSGGNSYDTSVLYKENIQLIRELLKDDALYEVDLLRRTASFTDKGKKWLADKSGVSNLYDVQRTYEIEEFDNLQDEEKKNISNRLNLQNTFLQLLLALTVYERDVDYIVEGDKVKIIDPHTGRVKESSRWEYGLHTAMEVKEGVKPQLDSDGMAVISLKNYFKLYDRICGMSGTIMPVEEELFEIYDLRCASLPTHKPCIREDRPLQIFRTAEEKDSEIIKCIINNYHAGRPTLVGSISVKRSEAIAELLTEQGAEFNKLDAKTTKEEAFIVAKAGIGNTITVSTSIAGRGTDIKPSQDALDHGGLLVVGTDLFDSVRVDRQLRGRTGRQGNPGSSVFYASLDDFILKNLNADDRNKLSCLVDSSNNGNINSPEIRSFFDKAQTNRENYFKQMRKETARKDDIIAPHRLRFYNQRNNVLFDAAVSETIISDSVTNSLHTHEEVLDHLHLLYQKTKELIIRSTWNNRKRNTTFIPYTDNMHTFAILFDVQKIQMSFEYFCSEYKRQIVLQVYDKLWKRFVLHVMSNLDKKEIEMLEDKYNSMMQEINAILLSRVVNATIPFDGRTTVIKDIRDKEAKSSYQWKNPIQLKPDDLCPCGSNKKYCECHGKDIHSNIRKRRRR